MTFNNLLAGIFVLVGAVLMANSVEAKGTQAPPVMHVPSLYDYMGPIQTAPTPLPNYHQSAPQPDALQRLQRELDQERLRQAIDAQQNERANRISHMNACLDISANPAARSECLKGVK